MKIFKLSKWSCALCIFLFVKSISYAENNSLDSAYMLNALEQTGKHSILISAIQQSGLEKLFSLDSKVPRTLYAPTDEAFKKLPKALSDEFFVKNNKNAIKKAIT